VAAFGNEVYTTGNTSDYFLLLQSLTTKTGPGELGDGGSSNLDSSSKASAVDSAASAHSSKKGQ
jgi:hypothetical protein